MGGGPVAASSSFPSTEMSSRCSRAYTAIEGLSDEVFRLQLKQWEQKCCSRRTQLKEWSLSKCQHEVVNVVRQVRMEERRMEGLLHSKASAEVQLDDLNMRLAEDVHFLEEEKL